MSEDQKEYTIATFAIIGLLVIAPGALAAMFEPVRVWLVNAHVLVTTGVILPIGPGAGLDIGRLLILGTLVLGLAVVAGWALRRKIREDKRKAQQ